MWLVNLVASLLQIKDDTGHKVAALMHIDGLLISITFNTGNVIF